MRIFLSADIEGTCGIAAWAETERSTPLDYAPFQKQMTREVRAACDGAIAGGARDILVRDAHDTARNLDPEGLPTAARLMRGWTGDPLWMMSGIDRARYDAAIFTGYHSPAGGAGSPLSHTMDRRIELATLNGMEVSEFLLNAYTAAYVGVPVVFLSGDKALCEQASDLIPAITTVATLEGRGGAVISPHPDLAVKAIREGCERAVKNAEDCILPRPASFRISVRFQELRDAYARSFYPGATLEDGKNVNFTSDDWFEILRFCHFVLAL